MAHCVAAMPQMAVTPELVAEQQALARWGDIAMRAYLGAVAAAFLAGRARAFVKSLSA